jgi:hypothetical protein
VTDERRRERRLHQLLLADVVLHRGAPTWSAHGSHKRRVAKPKRGQDRP